MLLRSALGMAIVMMLMGMAQNIWQFLLLRALLGLLGGFIPNANALIATQILRHKKRLGAGDTVYRRGKRRPARPAGRWLRPTTGDCAPSSL